jgi:ribosome-associated protein
MQPMNKYSNLLPELTFKATTSGGKGGQHVNKVASRIELYFNVSSSAHLSEDEKSILMRKLEGRMNDEGVLRITSSEGRSQHDNKETAIQKFLELISKSLAPVKPRKKTKPSAESKEERLRQKKNLSDKKKLRVKRFGD